VPSAVNGQLVLNVGGRVQQPVARHLCHICAKLCQCHPTAFAASKVKGFPTMMRSRVFRRRCGDGHWDGGFDPLSMDPCDDWSVTRDDPRQPRRRTAGGSGEAILEGQDDVETLRSRSQPHEPWSELDNPVTELSDCSHSYVPLVTRNRFLPHVHPASRAFLARSCS
jgi:hypothetical protein